MKSGLYLWSYLKNLLHKTGLMGDGFAIRLRTSGSVRHSLWFQVLVPLGGVMWGHYKLRMSYHLQFPFLSHRLLTRKPSLERM
jgi:hypothetical protein